MLVLSLDSKAADDLEFPKVAPAAEDLIEHSFNQGGSLGSRLEEEEIAPKIRALRKKKHVEAKIDHPTPDPILALPNPTTEDVANLAVEGSEEFKDKLIMQGVHIFPPIEPSDPPTVYSPLILPSFNKKEYGNQPADEEGVAAMEIGAIQGNELLGEGEITGEGEGKKVFLYPLGLELGILEFCPPGLFAAEMGSRQWEGLIATPWKIATNSLIANKKSTVSNECFVSIVLPVSDIADFYLLGSHLMDIYLMTGSPVNHNGYLLDD
ncbi:hypothetical protein Acr_24g0009360 [Actinidia rufa]|uniref:Uncharacterized protein n=1 Tax=Actinidia rufa TaxID=165716 RepID=A0A7J0GVD5_9ERIC|nr:hypothetical protein Acr_24g0009360 [Actinidia rufa]